MFRKPAWSHGGRTGPVRRFQRLLVFACEGLIATCDERPEQEGEFTVVTPADMARRVNAVSRPYRNCTPAEMLPWQRQQHAEIIRGCQNLVECMREARAMGDPSDPAVQAWWRRHRRNSTIRLRVSAGTDANGYPDLPIMPLGKFTGRTAGIDGKLAVHTPAVPQYNEIAGGKVIHRAPRKKSRVIINL